MNLDPVRVPCKDSAKRVTWLHHRHTYDYDAACTACAILELQAENKRLTEEKPSEGERQAVILAVALLGIDRPGWDGFLSEIAKDLGDEDLTMYKGFQKEGKS